MPNVSSVPAVPGGTVPILCFLRLVCLTVLCILYLGGVVPTMSCVLVVHRSGVLPNALGVLAVLEM